MTEDRLDSTERRLLDDAGLGSWQPPPTLERIDGILSIPSTTGNTFPEEGIEEFQGVDETSFWFRHRNDVIIDAIRRHSPDARMFVDVGSGTGIVSTAIHGAGLTPIAVEPHRVGARAALERGIIASFCADLLSMALPADSVPAMGAFDVIEHLEDPRPLLEEMRRVLRPDDGRIYLTVPAFELLWSDFDDWNGHYRRYRRRSLCEELESAGLDVVATTYFFAPLVIPALVSRVLLPRLRRRRREADEIVDEAVSALDPSAPLARILDAVHSVERRVVDRVPLPLGTSLLAIARCR